MESRQRLRQILRAELAFLEGGGYRRQPRYPWRPNFVFEDSPTCINYKHHQQRKPCRECPLMEFVPTDRRETQIPCRHIRLNERGDTATSFYEWGTEEELETALRGWLTQAIKGLESGERAFEQGA
jgi:hypothetical protein